ncbi:MAG: glycosyl hydrolase-related protein, partial [Anaerolineae bacterium]|nr:glycosyl hydrolase-related protein [Anaerolineae bacterium]
AARFGWAAQGPLLARYLPGGKEEATLPPVGSFLAVDAAGVVLAELKRATFGPQTDLILRLQETGGRPATVTVRSAFPIRQAWLASTVEEPLHEVQSVAPLVVDIPGRAIVTLRLRVDSAAEPLPFDG